MKYFVKRYKLVFVPPVLKRFPTKVRVSFIDVTELFCSCYYSRGIDMYCIQLLFSFRGAVVPHYVTVFKKGTNKGGVHFFKGVSTDYELQSPEKI